MAGNEPPGTSSGDRRPRRFQPVARSQLRGGEVRRGLSLAGGASDQPSKEAAEEYQSNAA